MSRQNQSTATIGGTVTSPPVEELAASFVQQGLISRQQVCQLLQALPNSQGRRQGGEFSKSFVSGAYVFSGTSGVTRQFPNCIKACTAFINQSLPGHTYTSFALFSQLEASVHVDSHNLP